MSLRDFDIIEDLKPIGGGWRYIQAYPNGSLQRIPNQGAAPTARSLVQQVRQFRINEGLPMGDPERDISEYIRKVSPNNDRYRGKGGRLNVPRPEPFIPLIQRVREWLDGTAPRKPMIVSEPEATERAQICIACQQNVRWKTNCGECNTAADYIAFTMRGVLSYPLDDALHGCRIHGMHLPAAVFIDRDDLPAKLPEAPAPCWMPEKTKP